MTTNQQSNFAPPQFTFQLPQASLFGFNPPMQSTLQMNPSPNKQMQPFSYGFSGQLAVNSEQYSAVQGTQFFQSSTNGGGVRTASTSSNIIQTSFSPALQFPPPTSVSQNSQPIASSYMMENQQQFSFQEFKQQTSFNAAAEQLKRGPSELNGGGLLASSENNNQVSQDQKGNSSNLASDIVEVFEDNFFEELQKLIELSTTYNYIAMDTEFPGDVFDGDSQYLLVRENVNNLKLIQLGITLSNEQGEFPKPTSTWQFNFKYDLKSEKWNRSSIKLLMNSGINFDLMAVKGISHQTFAEYFLTSGLVMNREMHWYGFHTDHDFGYLQRILTGVNLPYEEKNFLDELLILFPNFYDIKVIADNSLAGYRGSLAALSERLGVVRDDKCEHQAGSDSKITAKCFIELQKICSKGYNMVHSSHGEIFGLSRLNKSPPQSKDAVIRLLQGTNVKITGQSQAAYYESTDLYDTQSNSISPPQQLLLRASYDIQDPTYQGLGLDLDADVEVDPVAYEEEDPYFFYEQQQVKGSSQFLTMHPGLAAQLGGANQSLDYSQSFGNNSNFYPQQTQQAPTTTFDYLPLPQQQQQFHYDSTSFFAEKTSTSPALGYPTSHSPLKPSLVYNNHSHHQIAGSQGGRYQNHNSAQFKKGNSSAAFYSNNNSKQGYSNNSNVSYRNQQSGSYY